MKTSIARFSVLAFSCAALALGSISSQAQTTNKAPADTKVGQKTTDNGNAEKPAKAGPFHGKLLAVDKIAKTIAVGKRTFQVTSETRIKKAGKPATLEDGVVGETVSGYIKPTADGKLVATTINFGPKAAGEPSEKVKASPDTEKQAK